MRRTKAAIPQTYEGSEYDFGVQNMYGELANHDQIGVFVAGPFNVVGMPELLRLDAQFVDTISAYVIYFAYDGNHNLIDTAEIEILNYPTGPDNGDTIVYPSSVQATSVDFYVKFILQDAGSMINRYLLQVKLVN